MHKPNIERNLALYNDYKLIKARKLQIRNLVIKYGISSTRAHKIISDMKKKEKENEK